MQKLKPCPFCGCTDVNVVDEGNFSFIECSGCLGAFYQREACSIEDNVEAWNKRTIDDVEVDIDLFCNTLNALSARFAISDPYISDCFLRAQMIIAKLCSLIP